MSGAPDNDARTPEPPTIRVTMTPPKWWEAFSYVMGVYGVPLIDVLHGARVRGMDLLLTGDNGKGVRVALILSRNPPPSGSVNQPTLQIEGPWEDRTAIFALSRAVAVEGECPSRDVRWTTNLPAEAWATTIPTR